MKYDVSLFFQLFQTRKAVSACHEKQHRTSKKKKRKIYIKKKNRNARILSMCTYAGGIRDNFTGS